jgi:mono/diheme cytochrome c family protein
VRSLFNSSVVRCAASLLLALGAGLARAADSSSVFKPAVVGVRGAEIYSRICQGCHMPQGQGADGAGHYPKLADNPALASWQYVALTVLDGRKGMPSFGLPAGDNLDRIAVHLSDEQVADVVNYVRTHFGNTYKDRVTASQIAGLRHPPVP